MQKLNMTDFFTFLPLVRYRLGFRTLFDNYLLSLSVCIWMAPYVFVEKCHDLQGEICYSSQGLGIMITQVNNKVKVKMRLKSKARSFLLLFLLVSDIFIVYIFVKMGTVLIFIDFKNQLKYGRYLTH